MLAVRFVISGVKPIFIINLKLTKKGVFSRESTAFQMNTSTTLPETPVCSTYTAIYNKAEDFLTRSEVDIISVSTILHPPHPLLQKLSLKNYKPVVCPMPLILLKSSDTFKVY